MAVAPAGRPEEGVHVYGLFIEGARFATDQMQLAESESKVSSAMMPYELGDDAI